MSRSVSLYSCSLLYEYVSVSEISIHDSCTAVQLRRGARHHDFFCASHAATQKFLFFSLSRLTSLYTLYALYYYLYYATAVFQRFWLFLLLSP